MASDYFRKNELMDETVDCSYLTNSHFHDRQKAMMKSIKQAFSSAAFEEFERESKVFQESASQKMSEMIKAMEKAAKDHKQMPILVGSTGRSFFDTGSMGFYSRDREKSSQRWASVNMTQPEQTKSGKPLTHSPLGEW